MRFLFTSQKFKSQFLTSLIFKLQDMQVKIKEPEIPLKKISKYLKIYLSELAEDGGSNIVTLAAIFTLPRISNK